MRNGRPGEFTTYNLAHDEGQSSQLHSSFFSSPLFYFPPDGLQQCVDDRDATYN